MSEVPVDQILSRYSPRYRPKSVATGGPGFSGARVFRIETDVGPFCLRGWPDAALPAPRILGLHRLLRETFRAGVLTVAVPVETREGATLLVEGGRLWQLEPWMPGHADFHANPTEARLRAAMGALAAWHRTAAMFRPQPPEAAWFQCRRDAPSPAVTERLERLRDWLGERGRRLRTASAIEPDPEFRRIADRILGAFGRAAPRIALELEQAAALRFALQPCLRDVWHDHVLFTGEEVTGLIDPSACRTEHVAADLSRLIGSLVRDDRALWDAALDEYARCRPLSEDERSLVGVLDRSGVLLAGLTWLDRRYLQRQTWPEPGRVLDRLKMILMRLEHLADNET